MDDALRAKQQHLADLIGSLESVMVAFSGGVDSSYLLAACVDRLGPGRVAALTVDSPLMPRAELATAREIATLLGAPLRIIPLNELGSDAVAINPADRCYHCKHLRFEQLLSLVERGELAGTLLHGENADDALDYRPGARAAAELGVRAPLAEAGLTKAEIRTLSRLRGLPTWDHPAEACLATRFPAGTRLTVEGLARVEQAEISLRALLRTGGLRVRDHFPVARIELPASEIEGAAQEPLRTQIVAAVLAAGYRHVALDLQGYRTGSMNEQPAQR